MAFKRPVWLIPLFFVAGVAWVSFRAGLILEDNLAHDLEGQNILVDGQIANIPQRAEFGQRFELDVIRAELAGQAVQVPQRILLNSQDFSFQPYAGETWRLLVRLNRPHAYQNPGGFDYEAYLFYNRIRAKGYVREELAPQRLSSAAWYDINRLRQNLGERIRAQLADNPYAGIVVALANGDGRGVNAEQWQVLRQTGTLHLIAISGLHISLIGGMVFFLARWLWALPGVTVLRLPAPMFGAVCALLAATAYAALAGFVIPTQRALIMLAVAMSGILLRRRFAPSWLLAVAALLVLLYDPLSVMTPGFWLSFAAVGVILFAMHHDRIATSIFYKWGYVQWAIALGMLPLMLAMFQQVSLVAPLANMLAVPVFDLMAVPLTLIGVICLAVFPDAWASLFFQLAAKLMQWLWQVLVYLADAPFSQWAQASPPFWILLCALIGVALLLAPRAWPARWLGVIWMTPLLFVQPATPALGEIWFSLLDVGQGLAAVVRTQAHTLVFDTGPRFGQFDTGGAVVEPYLRAVGVRRIDTLMISHGDNDHIGGADTLLRNLPTTTVSSSVPDKLPHAELCQMGQRWTWDEVNFTVLNPEGIGSKRANNDSCVLQVQSRHGTVLLPADIEAQAERKLLLRWQQQLHADILVAPHHGSKTSSTSAFIETVAPHYVLFPIGYRNRYHHPHPSVLERYTERNILLRDSASAGALEFHLGANGIEARPYRQWHRRYWYAD